MNQGIFGSWGLHLTSEEFAHFVATSGCNWDLNRFLGGIPDQRILAWNYHSVPRFSGEVIANPRFDEQVSFGGEWWRNFVATGGPPRLELYNVAPHAWADVAQILATPEVQAAGFYVRRDASEAEVLWNWPLRIGFLDNPESELLFHAIAKLVDGATSDWRWRYIQLIPPGELTPSGCHILLLPGSLRSLLASLLARSNTVRCACVIVLDSSCEMESAASLMEAVLAECRADGIVFAPLPRTSLEELKRHFSDEQDQTLPNLFASWFIDLVRNLSHDHPLDVALFLQWRRLGSPGLPPIIAASRRLIHDSRISRRLLRLARQLKSPDLMDQRLFLSEDRPSYGRYLPYMYGGRFGDLGDHILADPFRYLYESESGEGGEMIDILEAFRRTRAEKEQRTPRWVQARVIVRRPSSWENGRIRPEFVDQSPRSFEPGRTHFVDVFVGPREENAIAPPSDAPPLPEESLPDDRGVTLTIVLAEADEKRPPQVQKVRLPRAGRSSTCRFAIRVDENAQQVEARVIVLFRNRILQTLMITGSVAGDKESKTRITIAPEAVIQKSLDSLEGRTDFDASIVLNDAVDGTPAMTAVHDDTAVRIPLPHDIETAAKWFDECMESVADNAEDFKAIDSEANLELLRRMARKGSLLWRRFNHELPRGIDMSRLERIQIVSTNSSTRLPIEFFYDRAAPHEEAKLCPGARTALRTGKPCKACMKRSSGDRSFVCPEGFWGLRKILERHMHKEHERGDRNELRPAERIGDRLPISILGPYLFAGSDHVDAVDPGSMKRVKKALRSACGAPDIPIATWNDWTSEIKKSASQLLFIIPHVVEDDEPSMEIGAGSSLKASLIDGTHVRGPGNRNFGPVVVLLGCKTANSTIPFADLPAAFSMLGVPIVLCTGAPVVGRHAVRVAELLLKELRAAVSKTPRSLGDVIREVRRGMLADGLPMCLTVLALGDFDWQISAGPVGPAARSRTTTRKKGGKRATT